MLDIDERPWPQDGDKLFIEEGDWRTNARLNAERDNLTLYAVGFKLAGKYLVDQVIADKANYDSLIFPIAFAYRQYIELRLKQLIRDGYQFVNKPLPSTWHDDWKALGYPAQHKVDILWKECRPILEQAAPQILNSDKVTKLPQTLEAIDMLVAELAQVDPESMSFRYSKDRKNNPSLPKISSINLLHLSEVMDKIANFFERLSWPITQAVSDPPG